MWTMYLKIYFYWWAELVLIFKFKDTAAGAHALLWGPKGIRSVQQCLSHSSCHEVWTFRLWLQKLVYLVNDFSPLVRKILEISFFFKSLSLSGIAACVSELPWRLRTLPACPQLSCNVWSGVLVCQWAGQSVKNKFVCKRCF